MDDNLEQLWGDGSIRIFISHVSTDQAIAYELKEHLQGYGIAAFVAHNDVEPMRGWENEILRALFSMDLLVALLTEQFRESKWTDQEVGVALGRQVPVVPVRMALDPYGFIGKCQGFSWTASPSNLADRVFSYVLGNANLRSSAADCFIQALDNSVNFKTSNRLAGYLEQIALLTPEQEQSLVAAYNANDQVYHANQMKAHIEAFLYRTTDHAYQIADNVRLRRLDG